MKTKTVLTKVLSVFLVVLMFASVSPLNAFADTEADPEVGHALIIQSDHMTVTKRKTVKMTASVTNVDVQPKITWKSDNEAVATVDQNGNVKGVDAGKALIIVTAVVDGETLRGEFPINVVTGDNIIKNLLEERQILSYQYSYVDDYYYTNDKEAWQYNFGFGKIYDFVSPYILLEYDYIRVFFLYEDKDWMLQMWKGQYGMIFYGSEIGIYNRPHSDEEITEWTMFACPAEEDWLKMEMTLYHEQLDGTWKREFTREYDYYWWCTGFKNGHLRVEEPANELRMTGRITFKDEEMTKLVSDALVECGLSKSTSKDKMSVDGIYVDGNDVYFSWQNISEAESTMLIKVGGGFLYTLSLLPFFPIILPFVNTFVILVMLVNVVL